MPEKKERRIEDEYGREAIQRQLGDSPQNGRQREVMDMDIEDIERELAATGLAPGPESDQPSLEEEIEAKIEMTEQALDKNLRRRAEHAGITTPAGAQQEKKRRSMGVKLPRVSLLQGLVRNVGKPTGAFTAYDCSDRSNIVES
jgi:hypothetical protein